MKSNYLKITRIISILVLLLLLGYVFYIYLAPLGNSRLSINFGNSKLPSYVEEINGTSSPEKNLKTGESYRRVLQSMVGLKLKLFGDFEKLKVKLKYVNKKNPFVLIYGVAKSQFENKKSSNLISKIIENNTFDKLDWYKISDKNSGMILFQKGDDSCAGNVEELKKEKDYINENVEYADCAAELDKDGDYLKFENKNKKKKWVDYKFDSVPDFLNNLSETTEDKKVCYLNLDLNDKLSIADYSKSDEINTFDTKIRGFHVLETYIDNEDLNYNFEYEDLNQKKGSDEFKIYVYKGDEMIFEEEMADDGNKSNDEDPSEIENGELKIENLEKGRYKIYLDASDEIVFNKIETSQKYWVFLENLTLLDPEKEIILYTNSSKLDFTVNHEQSLQKIILKNEKDFTNDENDNDEDVITEKKINVSKIDKTYLVKPKWFSKIEIKKADMDIEFDGRLSNNLKSADELGEVNLINYLTLKKYKNPACDYIISDYFEPIIEKGDNKTGTAEFDLDELKSDKNAINLILDFPKYNRSSGDDIKLKEMYLEYYK